MESGGKSWPKQIGMAARQNRKHLQTKKRRLPGGKRRLFDHDR
jgi:hypothetical protein